MSAFDKLPFVTHHETRFYFSPWNSQVAAKMETAHDQRNQLRDDSTRFFAGTPYDTVTLEQGEQRDILAIGICLGQRQQSEGLWYPIIGLRNKKVIYAANVNSEFDLTQQSLVRRLHNLPSNNFAHYLHNGKSKDNNPDHAGEGSQAIRLNTGWLFVVCSTEKRFSTNSIPSYQLHGPKPIARAEARKKYTDSWTAYGARGAVAYGAEPRPVKGKYHYSLPEGVTPPFPALGSGSGR